MKRGIILVLLVLLMPFTYADIPIQDVSEGGQQLPSQQEGITYYAVMSNDVVASVIGSEVNYHHKDRMGSNIKTSNGGVVSESLALPFGRELKQPDYRFTFTGKERDVNSGLYYFGARYYDYDTGRFVSADPVMDELPYVYVNNNPLRFVDPTGMMSTTRNQGSVVWYNNKDVALRISGETRGLMKEFHFDIYQMSQEGSTVEDISGWVLGTVVNRFDYDESRVSGSTYDYYDPYYRSPKLYRDILMRLGAKESDFDKGGFPELGNLLEKGRGVCYEIGVFVAHTLASDPTIQESGFNILLAKVGIFGEDAEGDFKFTGHLAVLLVPPGELDPSLDSYVRARSGQKIPSTASVVIKGGVMPVEDYYLEGNYIWETYEVKEENQ